jgi:serine/threonine-protein kinase ATR
MTRTRTRTQTQTRTRTRTLALTLALTLIPALALTLALTLALALALTLTLTLSLTRYLLSYVTMSQWKMVQFTGEEFGTLALVRWIPLAYVVFLLISAATALPALCSFKSIHKSFGTFGVDIAALKRKDSKV